MSKCWCGCGEEVSGKGSFFNRGHDKAAESMLDQIEYGFQDPIKKRLEAAGYGPDGKNLREEYEKMKARVAAVITAGRS